MVDLPTLNSSKAKMIVLYLYEKTQATAEQIKNEVGLSLLELLPILRKLETKGILTRSDEYYTLAEDLSI